MGPGGLQCDARGADLFDELVCAVALADGGAVGFWEELVQCYFGGDGVEVVVVWEGMGGLVVSLRL